MNPKRRIWQVYLLARDQGCNTTADLADVLKITVGAVSSCVSELVENGWLKRTGRTMASRNDRGFGRRYQVFEAADLPADQGAREMLADAVFQRLITATIHRCGESDQ